MADSRRELLVKASKTALEVSSVTWHGEETTKPSGLHVHRHLGRPVNQSDLPDVILNVFGEDHSELAENTTDQSQRIVELGAHCRALAAPDKSADESLDEILTWTEIALLSDHTLGGVAAEGHYVRTDRVFTEEYSEAYAEAVMRFRFIQLTKWGDPRQAP